MGDLILDTNIFSDFLAQYFDPNTGNYGMGRFKERENITVKFARKINALIDKFIATDDPLSSGLIITSAFAFVELARKFGPISKGRFQLENVYDFLQYHPDWFSIAPVDVDLLPFFIDVPAYVVVGERLEPIEWADAIHVATTYSRGGTSSIAATDQKIRAISSLAQRLAL